MRVQNLRQPIQAVIRIGQLIGRRIRTGALIEAKLHGGQIPVNGIVGILLREIPCPYDPALLAQTVGRVIQVLRPLDDAAAALLPAADQTAQGVILEAVFLRNDAVLLRVLLCKLAVGVVNIMVFRNGNMIMVIVHLRD